MKMQYLLPVAGLCCASTIADCYMSAVTLCICDPRPRIFSGGCVMTLCDLCFRLRILWLGFANSSTLEIRSIEKRRIP